MMEVERVYTNEETCECDCCPTPLGSEAIQIVDSHDMVTLLCEKCANELLAGLVVVTRPANIKLN